MGETEPTAEEIARVEAWQAARSAERKAAADAEYERRRQREWEKQRAAEEEVTARFRGKRIVEVTASSRLDGKCLTISRLCFVFDDESTVELEASDYDGPEIEIMWRPKQLTEAD